ncbi:MAG TPA: hypothetical protein VGY97_12705 [Solirubrobacteraceae bacterium]|nr:hypothetical protein [Solirubrobacteraceae bacterium]
MGAEEAGWVEEPGWVGLVDVGVVGCVGATGTTGVIFTGLETWTGGVTLTGETGTLGPNEEGPEPAVEVAGPPGATPDVFDPPAADVEDPPAVELEAPLANGSWKPPWRSGTTPALGFIWAIRVFTADGSAGCG